jgi:hypothetical protein
MEPFTIQVKFSLGQYITLILTRFVRRPFFIVVVIIMAMYLLLGIFAQSPDYFDRSMVILPLFYFVGLPALMAISAARIYKKSPALQHGITYTFSDDDINAVTDGSQGITAWRNIVKRQEMRGYLYLYPNRTNVYLIPLKSLTPAQLEWIKGKIPQKKGLFS